MDEGLPRRPSPAVSSFPSGSDHQPFFGLDPLKFLAD